MLPAISRSGAKCRSNVSLEANHLESTQSFVWELHDWSVEMSSDFNPSGVCCTVMRKLAHNSRTRTTHVTLLTWSVHACSFAVMAYGILGDCHPYCEWLQQGQSNKPEEVSTAFILPIAHTLP